VPASLLLGGTPYAFPVDLALSGLIPMHAYYGMINIVHDYVPKSIRGITLLFIMLLCVLMALGLLRITNQGDGLGGTLLLLWGKKSLL
jgi:hypothetical protein